MKTSPPFESLVYPEPNTGCWLWAGYVNANQYGQVSGRSHNGFNLAHRYSYFLSNGEFDRSKHLLHKCDNTYCVNPDHLFQGTQADNNLDKKLKGRAAKGTKIRRAILTDSIVTEIRKLYDSGISQVDICKKYQLRDAIVCKVVNRKSWRHVI